MITIKIDNVRNIETISYGIMCKINAKYLEML